MSNLSEKDIALAGELALGLLDRAETEAAHTRCETDANFAAEVAQWQERLMSMLGNDSTEPPAEIWQKITSAINTENTISNAPDIPLAANDNGVLRMWQGMTALSGAIAAALAVMLYLQPAANPARTPVIAGTDFTNDQKMVAALQSETGPAAATASYNPSNGELIITPVNMNTGNLYPEIWVIPADGTPHSLGVAAQRGASRHMVNPQMRQFLTQGATIAITPEPASGGPGGKPTGAVMASGKISII